MCRCGSNTGPISQRSVRKCLQFGGEVDEGFPYGQCRHLLSYGGPVGAPDGRHRVVRVAEGTELIIVVDHNQVLFRRLISEGLQARVVENTNDRGPSGARNTSAKHAQGDIVVFLDDDAARRSGWLGVLLKAFNDPSVVVAGGWRGHGGKRAQQRGTRRASSGHSAVPGSVCRPVPRPFATSRRYAWQSGGQRWNCWEASAALFMARRQSFASVRLSWDVSSTCLSARWTISYLFGGCHCATSSRGAGLKAGQRPGSRC